jgi:hypothetical protein
MQQSVTIRPAFLPRMQFNLFIKHLKRRNPMSVKFKNPEAVEEVAISIMLTIVLMVVPVVTLFASL